jgi:hypothetical protein
MTPNEMSDMERRFAAWPLPDQIRFIERLVRRIRHDSFADSANGDLDLQAMAADPDIQRVLRADDLVSKNAAG